MPFNGAGGFTSLGAPTYPAVAGEIIYASRFNLTMDDVFAGLSVVWPRDGQAAATANIPMAGFRFTGLGAGATAGQALTFDQTGAQLKSLTVTEQLVISAPLISFTGNATLTGSWDFRGAALLVATQPAGTSGNTPASVDFVSVAIQNAAVSFIPVVSQSHEALGILNFFGA